MPRDFIREKKDSDIRLIRTEPNSRMVVAIDAPSTKLRMIDGGNQGGLDTGDEVIYRPTTITSKKPRYFWKDSRKMYGGGGSGGRSKNKYQVAGVHDDSHETERVDLTGRKIRTSTAGTEGDVEEQARGNKKSLMLNDQHIVWWKRFRFKLVLGLVIATILTSILVPIFIRLRKKKR